MVITIAKTNKSDEEEVEAEVRICGSLPTTFSVLHDHKGNLTHYSTYRELVVECQTGTDEAKFREQEKEQAAFTIVLLQWRATSL